MNISKTTINKSKMRVTKARSEILDILADAKKPICYDDFNVSMDKATFYRNISLFENENLIYKYESEERKWYFELASTPHAHFICRKCKNMECLTNINLTIEDYIVESIIIKGTCKECKKGKIP